jgi:hypothetical protein
MIGFQEALSYERARELLAPMPTRAIRNLSTIAAQTFLL